MNARERVWAALRRESADRVPIFMWFHPSTARRLARLLEIPPADVAEAMGNDVAQAWVNNNHAMEGIVHSQEGEGHVDPWGIHWTRRGEFNQVSRFPLETADPAAVEAYRFPADHAEELLSNMQPLVARREDFFIGVDVSPCVFEMYWRLRGMEPALLDMAFRPELADALLARCADFAVMLSVAACERFPVDWLWTGDDVAGQQGMIMSPAMWREMIKPHLQRVMDVGRRRGLPVAYHCCGALRDIIPDLIEMGIGILNPIQCNCPGMAPLDLKRSFGREITFMGGVDTQGVLPRGSADDVRRATAQLIEGMTADGGGYILAASHTVPPETPDENIFALYEAAGLSREAIFDRAANIRRRKADPSLRTCE
jgi:uroporphyrinogen decarboxylase